MGRLAVAARAAVARAAETAVGLEVAARAVARVEATAAAAMAEAMVEVETVAATEGTGIGYQTRGRPDPQQSRRAPECRTDLPIGCQRYLAGWSRRSRCSRYP